MLSVTSHESCVELTILTPLSCTIELIRAVEHLRFGILTSEILGDLTSVASPEENRTQRVAYTGIVPMFTNHIGRVPLPIDMG